ncbi:MAG: S1 RNA-binding domain-containing protein [Lachnospiraceae bacterium]|nr:S1 RNA-binding domain-containing protein [Lachnospiraceae bacterium]
MATESMKDYEHELNASMKSYEEGDIVMGTIIGISDDEVTIDLDSYAPGIVKHDEMSNEPGFSATERFKYGQRVRAKVVKNDDGKGNILLSFKEAEDTLSWDHLESKKESNEIVTVKVREAVKGGVVAYVEGIRGFIPASQISADYVEDLQSVVGRDLAVVVTEVNREKHKLVMSGKTVDLERRREEREHKINMMVPGSIVKGKVESIQSYGAFVDLGGGISGLIHISQVAMKRVGSVEEVLHVGDEVTAKILNTDNGKVSLSIRAIEEDEAPVRAAEEERQQQEELEKYSDNVEIGTSLGDILKNIKL